MDLRMHSTVREFAEGKVITVFGCGGDRDRTKRPMMGKVTAAYSDYLYVTSDNPRTENPDAILQDIVPGLMEVNYPVNKYELIPDRKKRYKRLLMGQAPKM